MANQQSQKQEIIQAKTEIVTAKQDTPAPIQVDLANVDMTKEDTHYLRGVILALYNQVKYWKNRYLTEHQVSLSKIQMFDELNNELKGMLRKRSVEVQKMVTEIVLTKYAAHKDIQEVVKEVKPSTWLKFTKWMAICAIVIVIIILAATNQKFADLLNQNAWEIVAVALGAVFIFLYYDRKKK